MPVEVGQGLVAAPFRTGVALWGYEDDGGFNGTGQPANNWVTWALTGRVAPSPSGADLWRHAGEILDGAAAAGADGFCLTVEWARTEPAGGVVDSEAVDRYGRILEECRTRGLEPVVALTQGTNPWWLGEEFWLTPGSPDRFAEHAAGLVATLGDRCRYWVTVIDPTAVAVDGWLRGSAPPGRFGAVADALAVVDNLLVGHVLAYETLHRGRPDAVVALGIGASSVYDAGSLAVDLLCARSRGVPRQGLDHWVDDRRAAHDAVSAPSGLVGRGWRWVLGAASPYGEGRGPLGRRMRLRAAGGPIRRPSPRRVVEAVFAGACERPLDALWVIGDSPPAHPVRRANGCGLEALAAASGRLAAVRRGPAAVDALRRAASSVAPDLPVWVVGGTEGAGPGVRVRWCEPAPTTSAEGARSERAQVTSRDVVVK